MNKILFYARSLIRKLWFRPLMFCILSVAAALLAAVADSTGWADRVPAINHSSVQGLLSTISDSMLVIAIFAVGAMLSSYAAASNSATPRSFKLIVADHVSQNALSVFIGAFIYSIVGAIALKNNFYGKAGYFTLFVLTLLVFAVVILTFLRWVDRISKLGRMGHTIEKIETATLNAMLQYKSKPLLGGVPITVKPGEGTAVYSKHIGYVQHIDMEQLQQVAMDNQLQVVLHCLPGSFAAPDKPLLYIVEGSKANNEEVIEQLNNAFVIKHSRTFELDPRFGLIALAEIASRALSPAVNDPGTAIAVTGSYVRLFSQWLNKEKESTKEEEKYNRVQVPSLLLADMFDDAFPPLARDGATNLQVMIRLQKAFTSIASCGDDAASRLASQHATEAFERASQAITYAKEMEILKRESSLLND